VSSLLDVRTLLAAVVALAAVAHPAGVQPPSPTDLATVLAAAARYLDQYEREVTAVIAHEDYQQHILSERKSRTLKSDLLILSDADSGWVEFRDVFEVDGLAVRDRDERIARLFMKPNPNALEQARRVSAEGARFNLSPSRTRFNRTLNVPLTALRFLRRQSQPRSSFRIERVGPSTITLRFKEERTPRVIGTRDGVAADGAFVVEPESGRILSTELNLPSKYAFARFKVEYAEQPKLKLWLPASMVESYNLPGNARIDGKATYTNFRLFTVDTSTAIGK
jgi:hypothetical protein